MRLDLLFIYCIGHFVTNAFLVTATTTYQKRSVVESSKMKMEMSVIKSKKSKKDKEVKEGRKSSMGSKGDKGGKESEFISERKSSSKTKSELSSTMKSKDEPELSSTMKSKDKSEPGDKSASEDESEQSPEQSSTRKPEYNIKSKKVASEKKQMNMSLNQSSSSLKGKGSIVDASQSSAPTHTTLLTNAPSFDGSLGTTKPSSLSLTIHPSLFPSQEPTERKSSSKTKSELFSTMKSKDEPELSSTMKSKDKSEPEDESASEDESEQSPEQSSTRKPEYIIFQMKKSNPLKMTKKKKSKKVASEKKQMKMSLSQSSSSLKGKGSIVDASQSSAPTHTTLPTNAPSFYGSLGTTKPSSSSAPSLTIHPSLFPLQGEGDKESEFISEIKSSSKTKSELSSTMKSKDESEPEGKSASEDESEQSPEQSSTRKPEYNIFQMKKSKHPLKMTKKKKSKKVASVKKQMTMSLSQSSSSLKGKGGIVDASQSPVPTHAMLPTNAPSFDGSLGTPKPLSSTSSPDSSAPTTSPNQTLVPGSIGSPAPTTSPTINVTTEPVLNETFAPTSSPTSEGTPVSNQTDAPATNPPTAAPGTSPPGTESPTPAGPETQPPTFNGTYAPTQPPVVGPSSTIQQGNTYPALQEGEGLKMATNLFPQSGATSPANVMCGAIQAVLGHPSNPDICFAGSVNGGVWRTTSCTSDSPDWTPLTDDQESLSITDLVLDEEDDSGNTMLVGIGTLSAYRGLGGIGIGLLYTTNALETSPTWQVLDNARGEINFRQNNTKFNSVFVRGDLMLASAYDAATLNCETVGLFRSTDRGATWTNVLKGFGRAVAGDPIDPDRFYATVDSAGSCEGLDPVSGVYTSLDAGETWSPTDPTPGASIVQGDIRNAKLSVSADGSRVWSGLVNLDKVDSISYSDDFGQTWVIMDDIRIPGENGTIDGLNPEDVSSRERGPDTQGHIHFSLLANPQNKNEVYAGGDSQVGPFPNFLGAVGYTGYLWRGKANVSSSEDVPSPQWGHMTDLNDIAEIPGGGTATGSGPHANSRDMGFRADGNILEGDDGGITLRRSPSDDQGDWYGLCGNLQAFEALSVAYEPLNNTVVFGTQDNGNVLGVLGVPGTFNIISSGDGNSVFIDYTSSDEFIFYYFGTRFYETLSRLSVSKLDGSQELVSTTIQGKGGFRSSAAMNPADPRQIALAVSANGAPERNQIELTVDRGETFIAPQPSSLTGSVSAMSWSDDGTTLYAVDGAFQNVAKCSGTDPLSCSVIGNVSGASFISDMTTDPLDANILFVVSVNGEFDFRTPKVFQSSDGGAQWQDITGGSDSLLGKASLGGSLAYIQKGSVDAVVVGTSSGILSLQRGASPLDWRLLVDLPTAPVMGMVYEPIDDTLVVSTMGRGIWFLRNASLAVV